MYRGSPFLRRNRERRRLWIAVVNRVPVYICINYIFVLSLTVEKAHVGRKIALASVHKLAEHLHAMSTQNPDIRSLITVKPGQAFRSVHTSANLFFHFSNKNGKRTYYLSLSYLHISKYRKKEKKRKWSGKSIIFFIFLIFKFKNTKNTVNG